MTPWKGIVGRAFSPAAFESYCHQLVWDGWRPRFIVLHNTAVPNLAQRPDGFTNQHIRNLEAFYRDQQHWSAGPHLFVDDRQIWVFTALTTSGVHSPSWNSVSWGVEMLGDYDVDSFTEGRGLLVRRNAIAAMASLCAVVGLDPAGTRLHFEDTRTNHRCPGRNVRKLEIIQDIDDLLKESHAGEHTLATVPA